jgi:hypothetical protein
VMILFPDPDIRTQILRDRSKTPTIWGKFTTVYWASVSSEYLHSVS